MSFTKSARPCLALLLALSGCGPNLTNILDEMGENPFAIILAPLAVPMAIAYDGIHAVTGASADDIGRVLDVGIAGMGMAGASMPPRTSMSGPLPGAAGIAGGALAARTSIAGPSTPRTGQLDGWSQRGAFEDCARLYGSYGDQRGAAECQARANRMSSIPR